MVSFVSSLISKGNNSPTLLLTEVGFIDKPLAALITDGLDKERPAKQIKNSSNFFFITIL